MLWRPPPPESFPISPQLLREKAFERHPDTRIKTRAELERLVLEFLERGGEITICPFMRFPGWQRPLVLEEIESLPSPRPPRQPWPRRDPVLPVEETEGQYRPKPGVRPYRKTHPRWGLELIERD
jgi:hypothetical protein